MIHPRLWEGWIISFVFSSTVTIGHLFLFDLRLNPRMILQPWLLQHGFLQYANIPDEHGPLLPQLLAWLLTLGKGKPLNTVMFVYAGLIFCSIFLSLLWLYQMSGRWAALAGGAYFIAWSNFGGYWSLWYELALSPLYLVIFFSLVKPFLGSFQKVQRRISLIGLIAGFSVLIKQQAILVVFLIVLWLLLQYIAKRITIYQFFRLLLIFIVVFSLPLFTYCLYFWSVGGKISDIAYWMFTFNLTSDYSKTGFLLPNRSQFERILVAFSLLVPFIVSIFVPSRTQLHPGKGTRFWLVSFLLISIVMQYPRYTTLHWATALPFIAIGSGIICADLMQFTRKEQSFRFVWRGMYIALVLIWLSNLFTAYVPRLSTDEPRKLIEYESLQELAASLKDRELAGSTILIYPDNESLSNLYYLLGAFPPKYWLMTYPWFLNQYTLSRWEEAVKTEKPELIILFDDQLAGTYDQQMVNVIKSMYQEVDTLQWQNSNVHIMAKHVNNVP